MTHQLIIFVQNFSSQKREEFFEKELPVLVNHFKKITVIPLYAGNEILTFSHPNIEIKQFNAFAPCNRISILFKNFFSILRIYFFEFSRTHAKSFYLKNSVQLLNSLILKTATSQRMEEEFKNELAQTVFYTYWFDQWTLILSLLKKRNPSLKLVSRVHGSDYKEEQIHTILPFRYFQLSKVSRVFPVSEYAKNYLVKKFKVSPDKLFVNRLGLGSTYDLSPIDATQLTIVSCSSLIPLKRVHLIVEILKHFTVQVRWKHFGNGPEFEKLTTQLEGLPKNIQAELVGYVPNKDFINYLQKNAISFFMNVSENEGLPVSLMEAAACGIPLIGTNVSGVPEIVNKTTGKIFPVDFEPKSVANYIQQEHQGGEIYQTEFRKSIQTYCRENFSSQHNFSQLANYLNF